MFLKLVPKVAIGMSQTCAVRSPCHCETTLGRDITFARLGFKKSLTGEPRFPHIKTSIRYSRRTFALAYETTKSVDSGGVVSGEIRYMHVFVSIICGGDRSGGNSRG